MTTEYLKRFSTVVIFNLAMFALCCEARLTDYTLTWLPAESTYNGKPFVDLGNGSGSTDPADDNPDRVYAEILFNETI